MKIKTAIPGQKMFILYDGRAKFGDADDAQVLVTAESEEEAQQSSKDFKGYDAVWYESVCNEDGVFEDVGPRPDLGAGYLL